MSTDSFVDSAIGRLRDVGLDAAELVDATADREHFGSGQAVFRVGSLILRFVRDRGQEFLDVAAATAPEHFHQFTDVEVAMGWKTIDQVLAMREPEALGDVLARMRQHLDELEEAFSAEQERFTRARVDRAARKRGQAFVERLRR